jgi:hypothetical protein
LVEEVLNAYWDASEKEEPCVYTIDMAWEAAVGGSRN